MAPTSKATSMSVKAVWISTVATMSASRGKAQSWSSRTTPFRAASATGMSSMWRMTFWFGPKTSPLAILQTRE